jgi:carbon-monoxide dehydrogenase iron sulfur subunit
MKIIGVHRERCTGCKTCELYCGAERGSEGKTLLAAVQEKPVPRSRVRVEGRESVCFPLQCRHCLREEFCIGCWTCTAFCPYGVIYPCPERKVAMKCDRCLYMEKPVCVDVCPTRALELVDLEEIDGLLSEKRSRTAEATAGGGEGLFLLDI